MMEILICRILLASGLLVGVLLAGGQSEQLMAPVLLVLLGVALLRRVAPSLPWRPGHGRHYY
jgi:hypothetical protein